MAHIPPEIQVGPPKDESTGSKTSKKKKKKDLLCMIVHFLGTWF